jgi:hypothetical protein
MITLVVGPTVISVCESTAKCAVFKPTETLFDLLLHTIEKNNYICEIVYSENLQLAKKVAYYAGGSATDDEMIAKAVESEFE